MPVSNFIVIRMISAKDCFKMYSCHVFLEKIGLEYRISLEVKLQVRIFDRKDHRKNLEWVEQLLFPICENNGYDAISKLNEIFFWRDENCEYFNDLMKKDDKLKATGYFVSRKCKSSSSSRTFDSSIVEDDLLCIACYDAISKIKFSPCKHICLCETCFGRLVKKTCPLCRSPIIESEIYDDEISNFFTEEALSRSRIEEEASFIDAFASCKIVFSTEEKLQENDSLIFKDSPSKISRCITGFILAFVAGSVYASITCN